MLVVSAGTVTATDTLPEAHATCETRPEIEGDDDNTQLVAPDTDADNVTDPPPDASEEGDAENPVIVGAATAADARDTPTTTELPTMTNAQTNATTRPRANRCDIRPARKAKNVFKARMPFCPVLTHIRASRPINRPEKRKTGRILTITPSRVNSPASSLRGTCPRRPQLVV
ncbi:MAG: hypothetical protein ACLP4R_29935 [Solirubrobacteraceae bacterium]